MEATPPTTVHKLAAEAIGTLIIVAAAGAGAIGSYGVNPTAAGFALVAAMYAFWRISGGHFNPAVTVGSALSGRRSWSEAGPMIGAQFVGGLLAGLFLLILSLGDESFEAFDTPLGANGWGDDGTGYALWAALLTTLVVTFFFVLVFLALTDERNETTETRAFAPIGVGLAYVAVLSLTLFATGGTVNPAQSLGLNVFSGGDAIIQVWVFLLATLLGGAAAGFAYPALFGADRDRVAGSGLNFSSKPSHQGGYAPGGYQQPQQAWNQPAGGYQQPGAYAAPAASQAVQPGQPTESAQASHAAVAPQVEQPIIQDGWQWDPQAQQWIPAQQQAPQAPQQGGWPTPGGGEQTQVRPTDGV